MRRINLSTCATALALAVAVLSFVHPWGNLRVGSPPGTAMLTGSNVTNEVREVIAQKCGDCHSNNTRWPLYGRVAPTSWFVEHDVHEGRERMNLSAWGQYSVDNRIDLLGKMGTQLRQDKMPLKQYLLLHPEARLSGADRKLIVDWTKAERKRLMTEAAK